MVNNSACSYTELALNKNIHATETFSEKKSLTCFNSISNSCNAPISTTNTNIFIDETDCMVHINRIRSRIQHKSDNLLAASRSHV